jgi:hypothetical protein
VTITGVLFQVGAGYLIALFLALQWLVTTTYNQWKENISAYRKRREEKRRRLSTRFGKIEREKYPPDPLSGLQPHPILKTSLQPTSVTCKTVSKAN